MDNTSYTNLTTEERILYFEREMNSIIEIFDDSKEAYFFMHSDVDDIDTGYMSYEQYLANSDRVSFIEDENQKYYIHEYWI